MEPIDTIERDGWTAEIHVDLDPSSPADWTTVGTLAYETRDAGVGDVPTFRSMCEACDGTGDVADGLTPAGEVRCEACDGFGEVVGPADAMRDVGAIVAVPVDAWDGRNGTELRAADSWDDCEGWIYATRSSVDETLGADATDEQIRAALASELGEWEKWAQGEVFGVVVTNPDGVEVDACWGFYGDDTAREEAEGMLSDAINYEREQAAKVAAMMRE